MKITIKSEPRSTRIRHLDLGDMFVRDDQPDDLYVVVDSGDSGSVTAIRLRGETCDSAGHAESWTFAKHSALSIRRVKAFDAELE